MRQQVCNTIGLDVVCYCTFYGTICMKYLYLRSREMGKTYYLDLKTVIETLMGQSGVLQRELPREVSTLNESCLCVIDMTKGAITRCVLVTKSGQQYDGSLLLPSLYTFENWDVTLTPDSRVAPIVPTSPARSTGILPRQAEVQPPGEERLVPSLAVREVSVEQLAQLSHKQRILTRSVLSQINGVRSVAEIRARLRLSKTVVDSILDFLTQQAIIRFHTSGEGPLER